MRSLSPPNPTSQVVMGPLEWSPSGHPESQSSVVLQICVGLIVIRGNKIQQTLPVTKAHRATVSMMAMGSIVA